VWDTASQAIQVQNFQSHPIWDGFLTCLESAMINQNLIHIFIRQVKLGF
jgi:hypothetical protein